MAKLNSKRKDELKIKFDYNNMMADFIGDEHGFSAQELAANKKLAEAAHKTVCDGRGKGMMGWTELPYNQKEIVEDIIETAKNIYLGIREANDVTVRIGTDFHREDYMERNRLQREALRNCKRLLYLIDIAHRIFHLSSKRVKYWGKLVKSVKDRVYGWIDDDTARYMPRD